METDLSRVNNDEVYDQALDDFDQEPELTPQEKIDLWSGEIHQLANLAIDNFTKLELEATARRSRGWGRYAEQSAKMATEDAPRALRGDYDQRHRQMLNIDPTKPVRGQKIGDVPIEPQKTLHDAAALDRTVTRDVPFEYDRDTVRQPRGPFALDLDSQTDRQRVIARAFDETSKLIRAEHGEEVEGVVAEIDAKLGGPLTSDPQDIIVRHIEAIEPVVGETLDKIRDIILADNDRRRGYVAVGNGPFSRDDRLRGEIRKLGQLIDAPSFSTLSNVAKDAIRTELGLPNDARLAAWMTGLVDKNRSKMNTRLLAQKDAMVAQLQANPNMRWVDMNTEPRPIHETEVDKQIVEMRAEGLADGKIYRRLMREYHTDVNPDGGAHVRYVSGWYDKIKQARKSGLHN